jgi:hypothetical protein
LEWLSAMVFAIFCVFLFKLGQKWPKNDEKWLKIKKREIWLHFAQFRFISLNLMWFRWLKVKRAQIWALFCGDWLLRSLLDRG